MESLNDVNVRIGLPGRSKKTKVVHVNLIVPYVEKTARVCRMVPVAEDDGCEFRAGGLVGSPLLVEQEREIQKFVDSWAEILTDVPGRSKMLKHSINTGDHPPVRSSPYSISAARMQGVQDEVDQLLKLGIIVPSQSPWTSPIVPIVKSDGSIRMCVDYRKLNNVTVPDPYYIPIIDELILKVAESRFLSKLDMAKGFY